MIQAEAWCRCLAADRRVPADKTPSAPWRPSPHRRPRLFWRCRTTPIPLDRVAVKAARTPYCASTSTIIPPSHQGSAPAHGAWPIRIVVRIVDARDARLSSPQLRRGANRGRPAMSRPWSAQTRRTAHRGTDHLANAAPDTIPCSWLPPSALTICNRHHRPAAAAGSATAPPCLTPYPRGDRRRGVPHPMAVAARTRSPPASSDQPPPVAVFLSRAMSRCAMLTCGPIGSNLMTNSR